MSLRMLATGALPKIFDVTYLMLGTSACFIAAAFPYILSYYVFGLNGAVAIQAVLSLLLYPALAGAFGVFTKYAEQQDCTVITTFWHCWKCSWRKTTIRGIGYSAIYIFLYVDALAALRMVNSGLKEAVVLLPCLAVIAALILRSINISTQLISEGRTHKLNQLIKLLTKRLYLLPVSIVALMVLFQAADANPILGLSLMTGPMLYLLWFEAQQLTRGYSNED